MKRVGVIFLLILLAALVLLLVMPNFKGCSKQSDEDVLSGSTSQSSLIASLLPGERDDGLCDHCGAPASVKKRGYELCSSCYEQALDYYNKYYK